MPLVYQQNINATTKLGVWHIIEDEHFFMQYVPLQKEVTHPHKRLQHLAGRYLLKALFPKFPLQLIKIADTKKPFLADEAFHFSISHCGDYAAVMVSTTHRVGVDVEAITEKIQRVIPKFLSMHEQRFLLGKELNKLATLLWSVKETVFKWKGTGGVDFKEDIQVKEVDVGNVGGSVQCLFNNQTKLTIDCIFLNNSVFTWLITDN
jgi:phosphopantetheinyl transferase